MENGCPSKQEIISNIPNFSGYEQEIESMVNALL